MSAVTLAQVKLDLRITHTDDDTLLQILIDASEDECARFLGRDELATLPLDYPESDESEDVPTSEDPLAPSMYAAVFLLVRAKYAAATPDEITKIRACAETILMPYRTEMGI